MTEPGAAVQARRSSRRTVHAIGSAAVLMVVVGAWQYLPQLLGIPDYILPTPAQVWEELCRMHADEHLLHHAWLTTMEVFVGFAAGALLGMLCGFVLGLSPTAEAILSPYILALQIAPKVAFAPLFIMWLGYTVYPKILVAVLIVFFPIMVNVMAAMRTIDPDQINLALTFRATPLQIFRKIQFPAALPALFAGLRIGATLAVIGIVVGEMVGGNTGIGYLLVYGEGSGNTAMVFAAIILVTLIGIAVYQLTVVAERRVLHYLPDPARGD